MPYKWWYWHETWTSNYTWQEKQNKVKKIWRWVYVRKECNIITIFPIYSQFGTTRKPDCRRIVYKTYIFINSNHLFYAAPTLFLWVKVLFWSKKCWFFAEKCWHQQSQEGLGTKKYIFWNYICVCTYVPNSKFLEKF